MTDSNSASPRSTDGTTTLSSSENAFSSCIHAEPTPQMWFLVGQAHSSTKPLQVPILTQPFRIGRSGDNELCILDSTVSGHHAELVLADQAIFVRDLNSTNGTLLNGQVLNGLTELRCGDILHFGAAMFTLQRAAAEPASDTVTANTADIASDAVAQALFDKLISKPAIRPWYQPVVSLEDGTHFGYEVLGRSHLIGLETAEKMFRIAAQRGACAQLSRLCRSEGLRQAHGFPDGVRFFLNTDPSELETDELLRSVTRLHEEYPQFRLILEVHEAGVTSTSYLHALRQHLRNLDIGLAYDDFGAGQARLMELVEVPPDILKFDVRFIQGLPDASPQRRRTIASLVRIVRDLDVIPLAEGVERQDEADVCRDLGFKLVQGHLFGPPQPPRAWRDRRAGSGA